MSTTSTCSEISVDDIQTQEPGVCVCLGIFIPYFFLRTWINRDS